MQPQNAPQAAPLETQAAWNNPPVDLQRNKLAFGGDSMLWGIGTYFIPLTTVITALAAQLTTDKSLIGLISLAWYVAYLLPQLFAARMVHGKRRTKPYSVIPAIIGRQTLLIFALWLFITQAQQPTLTVWLLIVLDRPAHDVRCADQPGMVRHVWPRAHAAHKGARDHREPVACIHRRHLRRPGRGASAVIGGAALPQQLCSCCSCLHGCSSCSRWLPCCSSASA